MEGLSPGTSFHGVSSSLTASQPTECKDFQSNESEVLHDLAQLSKPQTLEVVTSMDSDDRSPGNEFESFVNLAPETSYETIDGNSASKEQPYQAVMVLDEQQCMPVPSVQRSTLDTFQLASSSQMSPSEPAGMLNCRGSIDSPLQEHLSSQSMISFIKDSSSLINGFQSSSDNNSVTVAPIQIPFDGQSSFFKGQEGDANNQTKSFSEKILDPVLDKSKCSFSSFSLEKETVAAKSTTINQVIAGEGLTDSNKSSEPLMELPRRNLSYSKVLAPPNVQPPTTGSAPECGVLVERIQGFTLDSYAWAVSEVVGNASVAFIGKSPDDEAYILIFVKTPEMAKELVNSGIWLRRRWLLVSFYQEPAVRLTVSNVLPFIPDSLIIEAFVQFGTSVYPILRKIPAAVRSQVFRGACSYRREIYLVKKNNDVVIPEKITVLFLGKVYTLEVSATGAKCYTCGSLYHMVNKCPVQSPLIEIKGDSSQVRNGSEVAMKEHGTDLVGQEQVNTGTNHISIAENISSHIKMNLQLEKTPSRSFFTQCNLGDLPDLEVLNVSVDKVTGDIEKSSKCLRKGKKKKTSKLNEDTKTESSVGPLLSRTSGFIAQLASAMEVSEQDEILLRESQDGIEEFSLEDFSDMSSTKVQGDIPEDRKKQKRVNFGESMQSELNVEPAIENISSKQFSHGQNRQEIKKQECSHLNGGQHETKVVKMNDGNQFSLKNFLKAKEQTVSNVSKPGSEASIKQSVELMEEWVLRSNKLKPFPKKKLAAQFLVTHPDLENMIGEALSVPGLYSPASFKFKKIKDFLSEVKQLTGGPKLTRNKKRKQGPPELSV